MRHGRYFHASSLLTNGTVLVTGGAVFAVSLSTELYDPQSRTWSESSNLHHPRSSHTASVLNNGKVLVAGTNYLWTVCELYDPFTENWTLTGSLSNPRFYHTASVLESGKVLVAGGFNGSISLYTNWKHEYTTICTLSIDII